MKPLALIVLALLVPVQIAILWYLARGSRARQSGAGRIPDSGFPRRVLENSSNQRFLNGLRGLMVAWKLPAAPGVRICTVADVTRLKECVGPLQSPGDEVFPLLKVPLPEECLYLVEGCPALVHPATGVVFGVRIGTGLCALRLPRESRARALAEGAARTEPAVLPNAPVDLAAQLGEEWVVPNSQHAAAAQYQHDAWGAAGLPGPSAD